MRFLKSALILSLLGSLTLISSQETVVLQQGLDNYDGFTWTNLLKPSNPGEGTDKYKNSLTGNWILTALFQC